MGSVLCEISNGVQFPAEIVVADGARSLRLSCCRQLLSHSCQLFYVAKRCYRLSFNCYVACICILLRSATGSFRSASKCASRKLIHLVSWILLMADKCVDIKLYILWLHPAASTTRASSWQPLTYLIFWNFYPPLAFHWPNSNTAQLWIHTKFTQGQAHFSVSSWLQVWNSHTHL